MAENRKTFWQSLEANLTPDEQDDKSGLSPARREFLQTLGFTIAAAGLAGCETPVRKAIPLLNRPQEIVPGKVIWYATTCRGCSAVCGVLAKTMDGRVIKVEGNPTHTLSRGGLCPTGQAGVMELYDRERLKGPQLNGSPVSWENLDRHIKDRLATVVEENGNIVLLTGPINGPAELKAVESFLYAYPGTQHVVFEPISSSAVLEAHDRTHGMATMPSSRLDHVTLIVGFDSDFLGTGPLPVAHTKAYTAARSSDGGAGMARHIQYEALMSLTGANADERHRLPPWQRGPAMAYLLGRLVQQAGGRIPSEINSTLVRTLRQTDLPPEMESLKENLNRTAQELWGARGSALLICGINDPHLQTLVNAINELTGAYGTILDLDHPMNTVAGSDREMMDLIEEMTAGSIDALIAVDVNPVFHHPRGTDLIEAIDRIPLTVAVTPRLDETSGLMQAIAPPPHWLEAWGDAEPEPGRLSLNQPAMAPLHNSREWIVSLTAWTDSPVPAHDYMRDIWRQQVFDRQGEERQFQKFWDGSIHDGFVELPSPRTAGTAFMWQTVETAITALSLEITGAPEDRHLGLLLYQKVGIRDGRCANNPFLQELPDPVTKVTWGNYASLAPSTAESLRLKEGDEVSLSVAGEGTGNNEGGSWSSASCTIELPVLIQPGQVEDTVAVAVGFGRRRAGRVAEGIGEDAYPLVAFRKGHLRYDGASVTLTPAGRRTKLAKTQIHQSMEGRPLVMETSLDAFLTGDTIGHPAGSIESTGHSSAADHWEGQHPPSLWPEFEFKGHYWAMAIDLNACTGCSACVVSCDLENNVPVVGREEVARFRDMHWLRIDRYYSGDPADPEVVYQPMLCQHCDHAPCENVCPVLATLHNDEGLNTQVYNRCVGTRYCENNCPIKTRRFNWFEYSRADLLTNMLLNPDVTVRSRGVMEKCSLCIQRIQEKKIMARNEKRGIPDGEIQTACQQSCPADAIIFGDLNDPDSRIARAFNSERSYQILEELHLDAGVRYLSKIRNRGREYPSHG